MHMCKWMVRLLLPVCLFALLGSQAWAASRSILEHPAVAVLPFENRGILSSEWNREELGQVYDFACTSLLDADRFTLVERARLRDLTDEYYLAGTGLIDPEKSVELGRLEGAEYLVLGSINGMTTRRSQATVLGAGMKRSQVAATVSLRLVDVETGRVVLAAIGHSRKQHTLTKAPLGLIRIGSDEVDKQQVLEALESAVDDAVNGPRGLVARMEGRAGRRK